jgi:hypothetical protein
MFLALLIAALALQAWGWARLATGVRSGRLGCGQAVLRYSGLALLPFAGLVAAFFPLVGLEEWLGVAVLSEPVSRAAPLAGLVLLVLVVAGSGAFAAWCALRRRSG